MLYQVYLRHAVAYVPSVARTEAGIYREIEPVTVVAATDTEGLRRAITARLNEDNVLIPTPARGSIPKPILLNYAKVKSWSTFEKTAFVWTILKNPDGFQIKPGRRRSDRGWEEDPATIETFPNGATIEALAERITALIQATNTAAQPRA